MDSSHAPSRRTACDVDDLLPRAGSGVILRRLAPSDLAEFQAYRQDPVVGQYQGWSATSDAQAAAFLREMNAAAACRPGEWFQLGIAQPQGSALVGDIGLRLSEDGREAEIGFTLRREAQGRGLATSAVQEAIRLVFECTAAERVIAITDARNVPSIRLLERIGMRRTGSRHEVFRGEPCIEHVYEMSR